MPPVSIQDPTTISQAEMPLIVNCNQNNFVGDAIDVRTEIPGIQAIDHSMLSYEQGKFVCQSPAGYNEIPMSEYMVPGTLLVFTELVNNNVHFQAAFGLSVLAKLNGPWYRKTYNWLQIAGQAIGLPWLSFPGLDDCSMDVIYHLKAASKYLPLQDNAIIQGIPNTCNPEQFYDIQLNNPSVFNRKYAYVNPS